jgi:hypothetical protein
MRAQLHIEKRGRKLASACKGSNWPIVLGRERAGLRFFCCGLLVLVGLDAGNRGFLVGFE